MPVLNAALVSAEQPPLEKRGDNMDTGHDLVSRIGAAVDDGDLVLVAGRRQSRVAAPSVGVNLRSRRHGALDEGKQTVRGHVFDAPKADPANAATILFGRHRDNGLGLGFPTPFAFFRAADIGFVHLDGAREAIPARPDHRSPQLVEPGPGRLVAAQAEHPLQAQGAMGLCTLFMNPSRIRKVAATLKPATLLGFHRALKERKHRRLFSPQRRGKPGPKGPSKELVQAIVEMKRRNPRYGCPRIAQQLSKAFGIEINKDVVRPVLAKHHWPQPGVGGPSWLTFIGHTKDSLWSVDLFWCESITLKTHWVLVVMDQSTRRIIGFAVHAGYVDGIALCCMFNTAIARMGVPRRLSSDNDPLFTYHRWLANLRILEIDEVKTVPYTPVSHPFVERLIGSVPIRLTQTPNRASICSS